MENIFDLGKTPYIAAPIQEDHSFFERLGGIISLIYDSIKVFIFSIPYFIEAFFRLIVPKTKKDVAGQVALITGAGNGIGKQIALRLAREGCKIAIVDIEETAANNVAEEITKLGVKAIGYHLDIANCEAIEKLYLDVEHDFGTVDILVNNAGIMPRFSLRNGTFKEIERVLDVNVKAMILMTHLFLEPMIRQRRGHIMSIASMCAYHPLPGAILYSTTKFAVRGFNESLLQELRVDDFDDIVHVTTVYPTYVATRKDLVDALQVRFQLIDPKTVANRAVDGMLRNKMRVCVPAMSYWATAFSPFLPRKVQNLTRDLILREKEGKIAWQN